MKSSDFGHLILHHFASGDLGFFFGGCAAAVVLSFFWDINLQFSETESRFRESQVITLRWMVSLLRRFKREPCGQHTTHRSVTNPVLLEHMAEIPNLLSSARL